MENRRYHVVAVNERSGEKTYCTATPEPHEVALRNLQAFTVHPGRRVQLEESSLIFSRRFVSTFYEGRVVSANIAVYHCAETGLLANGTPVEDLGDYLMTETRQVDPAGQWLQLVSAGRAG